MLWMAIAALSMATIAALGVGVIWVVSYVIKFLQPLLIPFAVAGVLAYLLEPVVRRLIKWGRTRREAVWIIFGVAIIVLSLTALTVTVAFVKESSDFSFSESVTKARTKISEWATNLDEKLRKDFGIDLFKKEDPKTDSSAGGTPAPNEKKKAGKPGKTIIPSAPDTSGGDWLQQKGWELLQSSLGGFLGIFGLILSLVIVPLYLYYFLAEAPKITEGWTLYVPLRASKFKDEVVEVLTEINRYLISFFRGQLVVSVINGMATAVGLTIVGLKFGWLIGFALCLLGIIPYVGIMLCWIPAMVLAISQQGSWVVPAGAAWWVLPLVVTGVFVVVQQLDGWFITPRIVGESVGLHPMSVIVSIIGWSLVFGVLLGAIVAVPMTASLKVLFQRYIWQRAIDAAAEQKEAA